MPAPDMHQGANASMATPVAPRTTPPASVKRTSILFVAAFSGTASCADANMLKVGVAFVLIVVSTLVAGSVGLMHAAVDGLVSQSVKVTPATLVVARTLSAPAAPTLTVATAKAPAFGTFRIRKTPSRDGVATSATTSGAGTFDADSNSVLMPLITATGSVLSQSKRSRTSRESMTSCGVNPKTKLAPPLAAMSTGALRTPVMAFVARSVA